MNKPLRNIYLHFKNYKTNYSPILRTRKELKENFKDIRRKLGDKLISSSFSCIDKHFDENIYQSINKIITPFDYFLNFPVLIEDPINAKYNIAKRYYYTLSNGLCFGKSLKYCQDYFLNNRIPKNTHINSPDIFIIQILQNKFTTYCGFGFNIFDKHKFFLNLYGLNAVKKYSFSFRNNKFSSHELLPLIEEGVYYISIGFNDITAHSIVIIKEKNRHFIFDPNIGTVKNGKIPYSNVAYADIYLVSKMNLY